MASPPLTVGVPLYNAERFARRCLESLCAETVAYRILISDNASTDGTGEICREFARRDSRIEYIRHPENRGASENFLFLLRQADSPFFAWRAYDDVSSPTYFEKLAGALTATPWADLAVGSLSFEDETDTAPPDKTVEPVLDDRDAWRVRLLEIALPAWIYGVFRRDKLLERYVSASRAFDYTWALDTLILLPFVLQGRVTTVPEVCFRQHLCQQSDERYRPKRVADSIRLVRQFWKYGFSIAREEEEDSFPGRLRRYADVIRYANGRAEKYGRISRRVFLWPYYALRGQTQAATRNGATDAKTGGHENP